jgi:hypothetical protein
MTSQYKATLLILICKHFHSNCFDENIKSKLQNIVKTIQINDLTFDEICKDNNRARDWYDTLVPLVQTSDKNFHIVCKINTVMCEFEKQLNIPLFSWDSDEE